MSENMSGSLMNGLKEKFEEIHSQSGEDLSPYISDIFLAVRFWLISKKQEMGGAVQSSEITIDQLIDSLDSEIDAIAESYL